MEGNIELSTIYLLGDEVGNLGNITILSFNIIYLEF